MKLKSFRVTKYKSIEDSNVVNVNDVTCLVGKNESGKTALLEALARINPAGPIFPKFELVDYPRKDFRPNREDDYLPKTVIQATFEIEDVEITSFEDEFGKGVVKNNTLIISRDYANKENWDISGFDEKTYLKKLIVDAGILAEHKAVLDNATNVAELLEKATSIEDPSDSLTNLIKQIEALGEKPFFSKIIKLIHIPQFFYFDEYARLKGEISLNDLEQFIKSDKNENDVLLDSFYTAEALIALVGASVEDFKNEEKFEYLVASMEAAQNQITDEIFEFYSQNENLEVKFEIDKKYDQQKQWIDTLLHLRIYNRRHRASVPFDKRSRGFVWFFSFLVAFSKYLESDEPVILLLDEPGLSLHAKGQQDILRYIQKRLAPKMQVIYTTHSPFMVDVNNLNCVRTVQDIDGKGTKVFDDPLMNDKDTVFPLQNALGYELSQTLFLGPNNLLVEGPSDFVYLTLASDILKEQGRKGLSDNLVTIPVGGADKLSTFISLLGGNQLNNGILMDYSKKDKQRIDNLIKNGFLQKGKLITYSEFVASNEADVEDLFRRDDYIDLVKAAYGASENIDKLNVSTSKGGNPRVTVRIENAFFEKKINDGKFNHYKPASYLLKNPDLQKKLFCEEVLARFENLFKEIENRVLNGGTE